MKLILMLVKSISLLLIFSACVDQGKKNDKAFYVNLKGEPTTINPITSTDAYASGLHAYIFDSLMSRDVDTYEWQNHLAESHTINADKTEFTFKLRKNVKWHDGKPFTAHDVKFSFDIIMSDEFNTAHMRPYYEGIKEVTVVNDHEVIFKTQNTYFKNFDVAAGITVLPKHFYSDKARKDDFGKILIGTGPYKLTDYQRGKKIELTKNPDFWGASVPELKDQHNFEKIVLRFVSDDTVSLEMLKKHQLDFLSFRPEVFFKQTEGEMWGNKVFKVQTTNNSPKGYNFVGWNLQHPILKDLQVRKALAYLFNRDLMIEKFEYGVSVKADGPVYPQSPYVNKNLPKIDYDPKKALEMLKQAGWQDSDGDNILDKVIDGVKTKFSITILEPFEGFVKYLTVFKEDAKNAGVDINIKVMEWNSFIKLVDERKFDAIRMAWSASVDWDPKQIWHSSSMKGGSNFVGFNHPDVDKLIDEARLIFENDKRKIILDKVQERIANEHPYFWFMYTKDTFYGHTNRIKKLKDTYMYGIGTEYWKLAE